MRQRKSIQKRTYDMHYDEVVIGCNLSALLISHKLHIPFIYTIFDIPDRHSNIDGYPTKDFWYKTYVSNSLLGFNIFGDSTNKISFEDANTLIIKTKNTEKYKITFNKAYVCDPQNVEGLKLKTIKEKKYQVVDHFHITSMGKNIVPVIKDKTRNRFLHTLNLRTIGKLRIIEAYSVLTQKELDSIDFNQNMAKFKAQQMLKDAGLVGRISNTQFGKKILRKILIKHTLREEKLISRNKYESTDTIKIVTQTPLEIFTSINQRRRLKYHFYHKMIFDGEESRESKELKQTERSTG